MLRSGLQLNDGDNRLKLARITSLQQTLAQQRQQVQQQIEAAQQRRESWLRRLQSK